MICLSFELVLLLLLISAIFIIFILILIAAALYYMLCRCCIYPILMSILPTISFCFCIIFLSPILFLINIIVCLNSNPIEIYNVLKTYQLFYDRISYLYKKINSIGEEKKAKELNNVFILDNSKLDDKKLNEMFS